MQLLPIIACFLAVTFTDIPVSADPIHVTNGSEPENGSLTLALEEMWTLGTSDDDPILGEITQILIDDQGNVFLLDSQLSEVKVISPKGAFLHTLGREGDGPGEFRGPTEMGFLSEGILGVMQGVPGKIIRLNMEDGTPVGSWSLSDNEGGVFQMQGMRVGGETVIVSGTNQWVDSERGILNRDDFLARVDTATGMLGQYITQRNSQLHMANIKLDENDLAGGPKDRFGVMPDGRAIVAMPRNEYEISIFSNDGSIERVFSREFTSWQRDEQATDIWIRILDSLEKRLAPGCEVSWEKTEPDIQSIFVTHDSNIWIQNSRGRWDPPAGAFTTYDVFSSDGIFAKEIVIVCEGDPRRDKLFFSDNDQVFKINGFWDAALARFGGAGSPGDEGQPPEPVSITCYKILP